MLSNLTKPWIVPFTIASLGIGLFWAYNDVSQYLNFTWDQYSYKEKAEAYTAARAARNPDYAFYSIGVGLISLSVSLAIWLVIYRVNTWSRFPLIRTPSTKTGLWFLIISTLLAPVLSATGWYSYALDRGDYPRWADTIAIPIFQTIVTVAVITPIVCAVLFLLLRHTSRSNCLFLSSCTIRGHVLNGLFLIACVLGLHSLFQLVLAGDPFTIPWNVLLIHLLFVLRADCESKFR